MNALKRIVQEDRRFVFLRLLAAEDDYSCNNFVVKEALAALGHAVSQDVVESDAAWLEEQGLLNIDQPSRGMFVYTITVRGKDVAEGRAHVPGVKKPEPGLDY